MLVDVPSDDVGPELVSVLVDPGPEVSPPPPESPQPTATVIAATHTAFAAQAIADTVGLDLSQVKDPEWVEVAPGSPGQRSTNAARPVVAVAPRTPPR